MNHLRLIFTLLLSLPFILLAQDKVRFADGKVLDCIVEGITDTTVWVSIPKGKKKKEKILPYDDLFSVVYGDTLEIIMYKPNSEDPQAFTVEQMRSYVAGASFARRNYKGALPVAGAFVAGVGGGLVGFWGLIIPLVYDLGVGYMYPQPRNFRKEKLPAIVDDFFIFGYEDVTRKKKGRKIFASSVVGVLSIGVYTAIQSK